MVEDSGYKIFLPGNANVAPTIIAPNKKLLVIQTSPLIVLHPQEKCVEASKHLKTSSFFAGKAGAYSKQNAATSLQEGQEHPVKE